MQHDELGVQLWLDRFDGTLSNSNGDLLYWQLNCQGQPWVTAADVGRLQGPLAGTEQYFVVAEEAVEGIAFVSRRQIFGPCQNNVPSSLLTGFYARLVEIALDEVGYEFPVAMPLRIVLEEEE